MIQPCRQLLVMAALVAAGFLLFARTLSGEKTVLAHLTGLVIAALAPKTICRPGHDDGLPLTGATH